MALLGLASPAGSGMPDYEVAGHANMAPVVDTRYRTITGFRGRELSVDGAVEASDPDGDDVRYRLVKNDGFVGLEIDPDTGDLSCRKPQAGSYDVTVGASDGVEEAVADVGIKIQKPTVTNASWYGTGRRGDPKPTFYLSKLDDFTYRGENIWDYFCAMPATGGNRHGTITYIDKHGEQRTAAVPNGMIGEKVLVRVPSTGKSAVLVVADTGPDQRVHPDRKIDISAHAAGQLGFRGDGVARVEIFRMPRSYPVGPVSDEEAFRQRLLGLYSDN